MSGTTRGKTDLIELMRRRGTINHKVFLLVKADPNRWRDRWYGLLINPLPEELKYPEDTLVAKDRDIPKLRDRTETTSAEHDACNMEPVFQPGEIYPPPPPSITTRTNLGREAGLAEELAEKAYQAQDKRRGQLTSRAPLLTRGTGMRIPQTHPKRTKTRETKEESHQVGTDNK